MMPSALAIPATRGKKLHKPSSKPVFRNIHLIRIRIRIQHFRLNASPDAIRIKGFDEQKLKKCGDI
jgi:hypothetical protein